MKKIVSMLLVLAMLTLVFAGCGSSEKTGTPEPAPAASAEPASGEQQAAETPAAAEEEYKQHEGGDLVIATANPFNNCFTPYEAGNTVVWGMACVEPLGRKIQQTADDWELVLAKSFDVDEENALIKIEINQGIQFHNGYDLTAEDVAWTIQSWLDYGRGASIGNPISVKQTGDYTLEVQYEAFNVNFRSWLLPTQIFSKKTFDEVGLEAMKTTLVGTGPYILDEFIADYSMKFVRNENYWQEHSWGPDTITFLYTSDATSMAASCMNGDVDYMEISAPEIMELFEASGYQLQEQFANAGVVHYVIPVTNIEDDPWYNQQVREAVFKYGLDYEGITNAVVGTAGYHTDAVGYKDATYYDEGLEFTALDYDKAKSLLAEAGYPDGFETTIYAGSTNTAEATVLQAELKKLGIEANVEIAEMADLQVFWRGENTVGGLTIGSLYFGDPILERLDKFYGPKGAMAGQTSWSDKEVELYNRIPTAKDMQEQDHLIYDFVVEFVQNQHHFVPLCNSVGKTYLSENIILGDMSPYLVGAAWDPVKLGCKG